MTVNLSVSIQRIFGVVLSVAVLTGCAVLTPPPTTGTDKTAATANARSYAAYLKARLWLADGQLEASSRALAQAISADPFSAYLHTSRATLCLELDQLQAADQHIEQALRLQPQNLDAQLLRADILYSRGDPAAAIAAFYQVLTQYPEQEEVYLHLARLHQHQEEYTQAHAILDRLLSRHPDSVAALLEQAQLYQRQGDIEQAEAHYRQLCRLFPAQHRPYVLLGALLEEESRVDECLELYRRAAVNTADPSYFMHLQATLLVAQRRYAEALPLLQRLFEVDGNDVQALSMLGFIRMNEQQWPQAEQLFRRALLLPAVPGQVRYWLAYVVEKQQRWLEAASFYRQVAGPAVLVRQARQRLSLVYALGGDYAQAAMILEELLTAQPGPVELYLQLAELYQRLDHQDKILHALELGMKNHPDNPQLYYACGVYYDQRGLREQMEEYLRRAIALDPHFVVALNHLAYRYAERGENLEQALVMAKVAAALDPAAMILDTLGWIYFKSGKLDDACRQLELAVEKSAHDPLIQHHLGDVYRALGRDDLARYTYQLILAIDPDDETVQRKLMELTP